MGKFRKAVLDGEDFYSEGAKTAKFMRLRCLDIATIVSGYILPFYQTCLYLPGTRRCWGHPL